MYAKCTSLLHVYSTTTDDWWFHESKERNDRRTRKEMEYFCHWWLASWKFGPSSNYLKPSCLLVLCLSLRQFIEITCGPHTRCTAVYTALREMSRTEPGSGVPGSWNNPRPGPMETGDAAEISALTEATPATYDQFQQSSCSTHLIHSHLQCHSALLSKYQLSKRVNSEITRLVCCPSWVSLFNQPVESISSSYWILLKPLSKNQQWIVMSSRLCSSWSFSQEQECWH